MRLRSLLSAVAGAVALLAPAGAAQAASDPVLSVEVTGIHVVDWTYATDGVGDECKTWTRGSGTQTLGIRTPRPVRYGLLDMGTMKLLAPQGKQRFAGTGQRTWDWTEHAARMTSACTPCGPRSEYGPCVDAGGELPTQLFDCRRRTADGIAMLQMVPAGQELDGVAVLTDTLIVSTGVPVSFTHCPPDFTRSPASTHREQPLDVRIVGKPVKRLMGLRRGQKVTLKGSSELGFDGSRSRESDSCTTPSGGFGYRECAVTDVTVEVRRIR